MHDKISSALLFRILSESNLKWFTLIYDSSLAWLGLASLLLSFYFIIFFFVFLFKAAFTDTPVNFLMIKQKSEKSWVKVKKDAKYSKRTATQRTKRTRNTIYCRYRIQSFFPLSRLIKIFRIFSACFFLYNDIKREDGLMCRYKQVCLCVYRTLKS